MNSSTKKLAAAALTAVASATAGAQSSPPIATPTVEVYGVLDAGLSRVTGLSPSSSKNSVISGIMDGSRLGFRGNEDLGGGYRAFFTMEHRLELDTGGVSNRPLSGNQVPDRLSRPALLGFPTPTGPEQGAIAAAANAVGQQIGVNHLTNTFWDRQIYVGLVTPVGAVLAGRQYTPAYETSAMFDTMTTQSSLALGQVAAFPPSVDIRVSNALSYRTQWKGWSGSLMYSPGEGSTTTGRLLGGNFMYKVPAFSVGLGYNTRENERGEKSLTSLIGGATITAGPGTVYLAAGSAKDKNPTGLSSLRTTLIGAVGAVTGNAVYSAFNQALRQDSRLYHVGYKHTSGPNIIYVAYSLLDDRLAPNADTSSYGVAYSYLLSKRTDLNLVVTHFDNKGLGQSAPGQAGFIGGVTASAGTDSTSYAFGLRHRF